MIAQKRQKFKSAPGCCNGTKIDANIAKNHSTIPVPTLDYDNYTFLLITKIEYLKLKLSSLTHPLCSTLALPLFLSLFPSHFRSHSISLSLSRSLSPLLSYFHLRISEEYAVVVINILEFHDRFASFSFLLHFVSYINNSPLSLKTSRVYQVSSQR